MKKSLDIDFEKAVRLLGENLPLSDKNSRKPILFHAVRVGLYLYENNYSRDIILAGVLHDALEFSKISEDVLRDEFGNNIVKLVKANSKDRSIKDLDERIDELIRRCVKDGKDALIVKAADILDSFKYYTKEKNLSELDYCRKNARAIFKHKPDNFNDLVFRELRKWLKNKSCGK